MSEINIIEIILGILELLAGTGKKRKSTNSINKTENTKALLRKLKQQLLPYALEVKEHKLGNNKVGLSLVLKPQERPPESLDITIKSQKIGEQIVKQVSVVGHCSFSTSYGLECEPHDPVRDLVGDIGELQKIEIGDKEIDRKLIIRTNNRTLTKGLLKDEEIRKYLGSLSGLHHFKVLPGKIALITEDVVYSSSNIVSAIQLIKRFAELLAFRSSVSEESTTIESSAYGKIALEKEQIDKLPLSDNTTRAVEITKEPENFTNVTNKEKNESAIFSLNDFKKEFMELQTITREIEFRPKQESFNQVIIKPWISGITKIKYDLTNPMKIAGLGQRYSSPSKPVRFSVAKLKEVSLQYPTFSELKDAVKVTASDKSLEEDLQGKYELLRLVTQIKGLLEFTAECSSEKIQVFLTCELNPRNIKIAYDAIVESVNILKMII